MLLLSQFVFLILHISKNLIKISRVKCMLVKLYLHTMLIVLSINDKNSIPTLEHNVALHHWKHSVFFVIQLPRNLWCICGNLIFKLSPVVFQNELFIQSTHTLLIQKIHQFGASIWLSLQQTLYYQITYRNQHTIGLIVSIILNIPIYRIQINKIHLTEIQH